MGQQNKRNKMKRIGERDGWICWICQEPINKRKRNNAHYGPSLDHVIRRADGGSNEDSNLKIAHRKCNSERHTNEDRRAARKRMRERGQLRSKTFISFRSLAEVDCTVRKGATQPYDFRDDQGRPVVQGEPNPIDFV